MLTCSARTAGAAPLFALIISACSTLGDNRSISTETSGESFRDGRIASVLDARNSSIYPAETQNTINYVLFDTESCIQGLSPRFDFNAFASCIGERPPTPFVPEKSSEMSFELSIQEIKELSAKLSLNGEPTVLSVYDLILDSLQSDPASSPGFRHFSRPGGMVVLVGPEVVKGKGTTVTESGTRVSLTPEPQTGWTALLNFFRGERFYRAIVFEISQNVESEATPIPNLISFQELRDNAVPSSSVPRSYLERYEIERDRFSVIIHIYEFSSVNERWKVEEPFEGFVRSSPPKTSKFNHCKNSHILSYFLSSSVQGCR